jgi:hypothetical protein
LVTTRLTCSRLHTGQTKEREMPNASAERRRALSVVQIATTTTLVGQPRWPLVYSAPSLSEPGHNRTVVLHRDGTADCDCPAGEFHKHGCTHIAAALMVYWKERAVRRQPVVLRAERCRKRSYVRAA